MTALTHIFNLKNILLYQSGHPKKLINRPEVIVSGKDMNKNRSHLEMSLILYLPAKIPERITSLVVLNQAQVIYWNLIRRRKHLNQVVYPVSIVIHSNSQPVQQI